MKDVSDPSVTASVHWGDKTLVLGSTVAIRCYIEESENVAGLTGKVLNGPNNVLQTAPLAYDEVKKQYYIEYADLPIANMRDYPAFAVYNGDKLVSAYRLYSPAAYANETSVSAAEYWLVIAMMNYGDSANAYWNEKNP